MKRLLAAVAALLLAVPASAAPERVLIITPELGAANTERGWQILQMLSVEPLRRWGVDFDVVPGKLMKTEWARTGIVPYPGGETRTYGLVIHLGFSLSNGFPTGTNYRPDSIGKVNTGGASKWPTVPQLFVGYPHAPAGLWDNTAACTTGVTSLGFAYSSTRYADNYNAHLVGKPWTWKYTIAGLHPVVRGTAQGIWRPIVAYGVSSSAGARYTCTDCDAITRTGTALDTVLVFGRYRSASETAPMFYAIPAPTGGALGDPTLVMIPVAMADSLRGGTLIQGKIRSSIVLSGLARRGRWDASGAEIGPVFCAADSCDTTNVYSGVDSLAKLGVRVTASVNLDSTVVYASDIARVRTALGTRLSWAPEVWSGTITGRGTTASSSRLMDVFGTLRYRRATPAASTSLPFACVSPTDTAAIYCQVSWSFKALADKRLTPVDRVLVPPFSDWTPTTFGSGRGIPAPDSLMWAFWYGGARALLFNAETAQTNEAAHFSYNAVGAASGLNANNGTSPYGHFVDERNVEIRSTPMGANASLVGTLKYRAFRNLSDPNYTFAVSHDYAQEHLWGLLCGQWYLPRISYYYHYFDVPTPVWVVRLGQLGGNADATPGRIGWWNTKWIVHRGNAINAVAGRSVFEFVRVEDL